MSLRFLTCSLSSDGDRSEGPVSLAEPAFFIWRSESLVPSRNHRFMKSRLQQGRIKTSRPI